MDDRAATPLALVFHELATNAAKYGALSVEAGRLRVDIARRDDEVSVRWTEQGGPPVAGEPLQSGFGTQLAALSIEQQLGGTIRRHWRAEGLSVDLALKASSLAHA